MRILIPMIARPTKRGVLVVDPPTCLMLRPTSRATCATINMLGHEASNGIWPLRDLIDPMPDLERLES